MHAEPGPLAVVVVNFNTRDHLRECLKSVVPEAASMIVVADNGSSDGSVAMVREEFPAVVMDLDPNNPGYGAGANRGIRRCGPHHVLLLNSDTRLRPGALKALRSYIDAHPRAGIVGPRVVHGDGSLQRSCFPFPTPFRPLWKWDPLAGVARFMPGIRERYLGTWSHDAERVVPWVLGAALVIRREAFEELGGFDESFFMYSEEVDLCYRMRQRGWEIHFAPVTEVTHEGCASTRQHRAAMLGASCGSLIHFYRRHYSGGRLALAEMTTTCVMALRLIRDRVRYALLRDERRRTELAENVSIWRDAMIDARRAARVKDVWSSR